MPDVQTDIVTFWAPVEGLHLFATISLQVKQMLHWFILSTHKKVVWKYFVAQTFVIIMEWIEAMDHGLTLSMLDNL